MKLSINTFKSLFKGFGDAVDNSNCWDPVISYVESQYEAFLDAETRVNRITAMPDTRVHACLYFIAPSGHGLKPLDVEFMKRLHDKVNLAFNVSYGLKHITQISIYSLKRLI